MNDSEFVSAYLTRLNLNRPERADALALRALHVSHLKTVPFENLDIHLGVPIILDPDALADKILRRRRGGFCYELNGLFARLLVTLGYRVSLHGAQVWTGQEYGPPLDHLALRVECVDDPTVWLADVGFGAHSLNPLQLVPHTSQDDPGGMFQILPAIEGDVVVLRDGVVQYRIEDHSRDLHDFEPMCWYQQTSPRSHFTQSLVCTIQSQFGRVTLSDRRLVTTVGTSKTEVVLDDDAEVVKTYAEIFGIDLDQVPTSPGRSPAP